MVCYLKTIQSAEEISTTKCVDNMTYRCMLHKIGDNLKEGNWSGHYLNVWVTGHFITYIPFMII